MNIFAFVLNNPYSIPVEIRKTLVHLVFIHLFIKKKIVFLEEKNLNLNYCRLAPIEYFKIIRHSKFMHREQIVRHNN